MPRAVLDTIGANYGHVREIPCLKFGYLNGHESAWPVEAIDEQKRRGELLALIDVLGTEPLKAAIIDWEHGDVQDPNRLRWWVEQRNAFRGDAVVYTNRDGMPAVLQSLHGAGEYYQLWVADLTSDGRPPASPPDFGLPPYVRLLGVQYAWPKHTGGPFDLSMLFNDAWHAHRGTAAHIVGAAVADRVSSEPAADVEPAAADASFFDRGTGQLDQLADVEPAAAVADPKAAGPDGATSSGPPWEAAQYPMPTGQHSGPLPGSAFQLQGPWGEIAQAGAGTAGTGPGPEAEPDPARPFVPAPPAGDLSAAAAVTAAAAKLDHAAVWHWIQAGRGLVEDLHGAGISHAADVLDDALKCVLEVGQLLAALGR